MKQEYNFRNMFTSYLLLAACALFPVLFAAGFFLLDKYTRFKKLGFWPKQVIIGVAFGILAILGTHCGIPFSGAQANVRDSAAVIAGLGFGWPAGLVAGLVGGVERFVSCYYPAIDTGTKYFALKIGNFTQAACTISTILAGLVSGLIRKFVFKDKCPSAVAAFFVGFVIECFHIFMVFVLRSGDYQTGYNVVKSCAYPMISMNSIAAAIGILVLNILEKGKNAFKKPDLKSISLKFTYILAGLTLIAFVLSETFVVAFQTSMSTHQIDETLESSIEDISNDVTDWVDEEITIKCGEVKEAWGENLNNTTYTTNEYINMNEFCELHGITEINIIENVDGRAIIRYTNVDTTQPAFSKYHGFDMGTLAQSAPFVNLLSIVDEEENYETKVLVQDFRAMALSEEAGDVQYRKYAGITTKFGLIQIGYDEKTLNTLISEQISDVSSNTHVGETGSILVLDSEFKTVSKGKHAKFDETSKALLSKLKLDNQGETFEVTLNDVSYQVRYYYSNSYYVISLYPTEEANLIKNIDIWINTFLEIIVFGLVFLTIDVLIKELVIKRIDETNVSLDKITNGNLDEVLDGGTTTEFVSLANGINSTVDALKGYIDQANKRIDEELAFAKSIQTAVLPSTFPAFPDRKEIDIYASMHTAKQVGGDFYDFYFSNQNMFHFTVADVSGKGIPAALFMMRAKQALKANTQTNMPINEAFEKSNNNLCEGNEAGMFVTAWTGSVNLDTGLLSFANGGHNPPLVKHANGKFEYLKSTPNMVLAAMEGMPYKLNEYQLTKGDIVYLYTDGVTEAVNEKTEQYGEARLQDALNSKEFSSCQEICEFIYNEVDKFKGTADQFDDITMVAFKYNAK